MCLCLLLWLPLPAHSKQVTLSSVDTEITIYGISAKELQQLNITVAEQDLALLASTIVDELHKAGFVAAEAFVISDKEIFLNQGAITFVQVFGLAGKAEEAVIRIAQKQLGNRVNVNELDEALSRINGLSGVDATFALKASKNKILDPRGWTPEQNTSHYTLVVSAQEQAQHYGAISLDSPPRKLFERNRATVTQTFNSVVVGGDHITGSFTHLWGDGQDAQNEGSATYFVPLMDNGLYGEFYGSYTASTNQVSPNVTRDFQGTTFTGTLGFPIRQAHDGTLTLIAGVGYQGEDQEGQTNAHVHAATSTLFYNHSDPEGNSITSGATVTIGDASSQSNARENGQFAHLRAGAGYIHSLDVLGDDTEIRLEAFGQLTGDTVPGAQKFILGGTDFLRGYPTSVYSGNNGAAGTVEAGHKYFFDGQVVTALSVKAFWDFGFVSNDPLDATSNNRPEQKTIHSVGLAYTADLARGFGLTGWLGMPLNKGNQGEDLDPTFYIKLTKGW